MKKFIKNIFLFIFPVIVFVGSINYFVDPAHIFNDNYEQGMVEIINNGKNVANASNYDERLFQELYINKLSEQKNVIVIGSSRSMQIREELFNSSFFNNSVSGAVLEDYIAITQLYDKVNNLPNKVILGVDPWIFNENHGQERWETLKDYYRSFLKHNNLGDKKIAEEPLLNNISENNLFSIKYFQESIRYFLSGNYYNDDYFSTKEKVLTSKVKLKDGSLVYESDFRKASLNTINSKANNYINRKIYSIEKFKIISNKYLNQFEGLINFCKRKNIEVVLFLPPYHPIVYNFINNNTEYEMVKKVELYLNEFANKNDIKILGSYNPNQLNLNSSDFYDGMHPKPKAIKKIFEYK